MEKLTYNQMAKMFREYEYSWGAVRRVQSDSPIRKTDLDENDRHMVGCIVFKESNWPGQHYSLECRTYKVSSGNKAYMPNMGGYSIFGSSLDGSDICVRLEQYMADEGIPNGWEVDYCYLDGYSRY